MIFLAVNYRDEAPQVILDYLYYLQTIRNKSQKTVNEYYLDLRTFFRFIKLRRHLIDNDVPFSKIKIDDITLDLVKTISLNDAYEYMDFLKTERNNNAASRARKCSSLKGYFNFLHKNKHSLSSNPMDMLEVPKQKKALPKYLTLEQSI